MRTSLNNILAFYSNHDEFVAAVQYTAGRFQFSPELVEKDFLCSLVLLYLYGDNLCPLVFKGGTLLAKVHAGFYRLSEDLDFSISIPPEATRKFRSNRVQPLKEKIHLINQYLPMLEVDKPLSGSNESRQYNATLTYQSKLNSAQNRVLIEIGLREEHITTVNEYSALTLITNPITQKNLVQPIQVKCLSLQEAYAEKLRAALTREKVAIRDYYDLHYALKNNLIELDKPSFIHLVQTKLAVQNASLIDFNEERVSLLEAKIHSELLPTLSQVAEFDFDLHKIIASLENFSVRYLK